MLTITRSELCSEPIDRRPGVRYPRRPDRSLETTLGLALVNFRHSPDLGHLPPAAVLFPPDELPDRLEWQGLALLPDATVPAGYVRIVTHELPPFAAEWQAERQLFGRRIADLVNGWEVDHV
jgi:hypothetical protein